MKILQRIALLTTILMVAGCHSDTKEYQTAGKLKSASVSANIRSHQDSTITYTKKTAGLTIYLKIYSASEHKKDFQLSIITHSEDSIKFKGQASLLVLDDENGNPWVPESSLILDENTGEDYICDSSYDYNSETVELSFGIERRPGNRLHLLIWHSKIPSCVDSDYTLYKISPANNE
ncbi:hypothetical protein [Rurimicrobium arvi]